jgi:hypothetical protein
MKDFGVPSRWFSTFWDEGELTQYWEIESTGTVLRQVDLEGPELVPVCAAMLVEVPDVREAGLLAVQLYEQRYGVLTDCSITEWDDVPHQEIELDEFERIWAEARCHMESLWTG